MKSSRLLAQWLDPSRSSDLICRSGRRLVSSQTTLGASTASTFALSAWTVPSITAAFACRLVRTWHLLHSLLIRFLAPSTGLAPLEIRQTSSFSMNVADLFVALGVECCQLLSSRCVDGLFEVRAQSGPSATSLLGDTIAGVDALGTVGGLVFVIEVRKGSGEAIRNAMFVVESYGSLDGVVTDGVTMC